MLAVPFPASALVQNPRAGAGMEESLCWGRSCSELPQVGIWSGSLQPGEALGRHSSVEELGINLLWLFMFRLTESLL